MPNPRTLRQNQPTLFSPAVIRQVVENDMGSNAFQKVDYETLSSTALDHSSSFRYNLPGEGIKSTQQLNVDWCFDPNTLVLTSELQWVPICGLMLGQTLIGFDENLKGQRQTKFRPSVVEHVERRLADSFRIVTDRGSITVSKQHQFVARSGNRKYKLRDYSWMSAEALAVGDKISFFKEPWTEECDKDAGYLAGLYDGEGNLQTAGCKVSQRPGLVANEILRILRKFNYEPVVHVRKHDGLWQIGIKGNYDYLRLLGSIRPKRLLNNAQKLWDGKSIRSRLSQPATILSIEPVGVIDVVSIKTSTKTLIANGFHSHNCNFENHTFFNSAHVKTNVAFRKMYDQFPFDGTQAEFEVFLDSLTGFEKYVYDQFPKCTTYLFLSGTKPSETGLSGTYVTVKDVAGVAYPGISRKLTGQSILNPGLNDMTIEFQLYLPAQANSSSFVIHKLAASTVSGTHGFGVSLDATGSTTLGKVGVGFLSGTYGAVTDMVIPKGQWNHIAFVWDRRPNVNRVFGYVNGVFSNSSSSGVEIGLMNMDLADLIIGSGSAIPTFTGSNTLSGAIDELRIWHVNRSQQERDEYMQKNVFAQPNLKLYMRFNEASGSQSPLVIDHSGNSLHGTLSTWAFDRGIRNVATGSVAGASPMLYEKLANNPVLFPLHPDLEELNASLLEQAEEFDRVNPNRIDRLIPKHYLLQGQDQDGLTTEEGQIIDALAVDGSTPDTAKLGDTQVILMLLYTWAKFFDEMKLYIQAFGDLLHLDYDSTDTIPDAFLQLFADKFGITLPPLFTGSSIAQFINAENIDNKISTNDYPLQYIQNQIWRRVLLNLQDVLRSKGTIHSVKTFIRSIGIEPDNNSRIREFGGPNFRYLSNVRENRSEASTLIDFSGNARVQSPFLSGSRKQTETGFPAFAPGTTFVNGIATNPNNGLYTSGSWTFEGIYRFTTTASLTSTTQSLMRIQTTGSAAPNSGSFLIANLLATQDGVLRFVASPNAATQGAVMLELAANVFDGSVWHISFGRSRADEISSNTSSSYFLRAAKQNFGEIVNLKTTSAYYDETVGSTGAIVWSNRTGGMEVVNASGSYLTVGSESIATGMAFLNSSSYDAYYRSSAFDGRAGHFRFWSKTLTQAEWTEHVRNFKSLGVENPLVNFNFVTNQTGSFGRLRMDVSSDQVELVSSNTGFLQLTDFSQNNLHWSGSFPATSSVIVPQLFQYSLLSPKFDVGATTDKVRVRSFQDYENTLSNSYAQVAPIYSLESSDAPQDSTRFTIDFSVVDALDQDIINIFATLDILDNVIGNPELIFSPDYPDLDNLRNIYFNRLTDRVNLKNFFEFYKWFDVNIGQFIAQLLPRKTKFLGTNFVIESHMLERPKLEYQFVDMYLGDNTRHALKDTILFQQFMASLARF